MFKAATLTADRLRELLAYDAATGVFTRRVARGPNARAGTSVGSPCPKGYIKIGVDGGQYFAHRLAWLYVYGVWPSQPLDHINASRADNRIANLREATGTQNNANMRRPPKNTSGLKGVSWNVKDRRWRAQLTYRYKTVYIGNFDTREEAHEMYCKTARALHGAFARFE